MLKVKMTAPDWLDSRASLKTALIFVIAFSLYFISRSPGLDEYDSVQFAMGVRNFNIWEHQPHPPGYPLFIFFGWIGHEFGASPEDSLHLVSSLGGALFVAMWFLIIRLQFNERLACWIAVCLTITPAVWMTATKVLSDSLATGFLSAEIFAALCFLRSGRRRALLAASLLGAAAAGTRPQLILVVAVILVTALRQRSSPWKAWLSSLSTLLAACLLWLVPMWYLQARLRPSAPAWLVYPKLLYGQWQWRLDKPHVYIGAGDWSLHYLAMRLGEHTLFWFALGFGFLQSPIALAVGTVMVIFGLAAYLSRPREAEDRLFWSFHAPWALLHFATIFICLDGAERYYLIIFPLILIALLRGFLRLPAPWDWSTLALPALLLFITIPLAITNHREEAPPIRLVRYLERLYPSSARSHVALLFPHTGRHAEWYAPEFITILHIPPPDILREMTKGAAAVYTDDENFRLPEGWRRLPLADFSRSPVIYVKHHFLRLFLIDRGQTS